MNVVVKCIAGSHLFGTNTPSSDTDYKGIYLPEPKDLLLGKVKSSINTGTNKTDTKNTSEDVDVEFYSLQKFMNMLAEGQTVALELLWTPDHMIIEKTPLWDEIVSHRHELTHKKVTAFVGYCKTQANKYGVKGSRMGELKKVINHVEMFLSRGPTNNRNEKLNVGYPDSASSVFGSISILKCSDKFEHVEFGTQKFQDEELRYIEVCGRKFHDTVKIGYFLDALKKVYDNYGERAKQAESNDGIDWKALSHAYRVCTQAIELLKTGRMTLPLPINALEVVRAIKLGRLDFKEVKPLLETRVEEVIKLEEQSNLQSELDHKKWCEDFVVDKYMELINESHS